MLYLNNPVSGAKHLKLGSGHIESKLKHEKEQSTDKKY